MHYRRVDGLGFSRRDGVNSASFDRMHPSAFFQYCPRCGVKAVAVGANPFHCAACGWLYFLNPAVAVGGFLRDNGGRVLFLQRAKDPAKGKLGLPGGFVDIGESAEAALRREVREEVGLELGSARFVCSQPNEYTFRDVTYPVLDLFFGAEAPGVGTAVSVEEVAGLCWREPAGVKPEEIAFPSVRAALRVWLGQGPG
jgi:ADP-ribose pyrophosphatase YjhB (NUDIX family)/ribosomal protein L37E